jgi:hypothetical protein
MCLGLLYGSRRDEFGACFFFRKAIIRAFITTKIKSPMYLIKPYCIKTAGNRHIVSSRLYLAQTLRLLIYLIILHAIMNTCDSVRDVVGVPYGSNNEGWCLVCSAMSSTVHTPGDDPC